MLSVWLPIVGVKQRDRGLLITSLSSYRPILSVRYIFFSPFCAFALEGTRNVISKQLAATLDRYIITVRRFCGTARDTRTVNATTRHGHNWTTNLSSVSSLSIISLYFPQILLETWKMYPVKYIVSE